MNIKNLPSDLIIINKDLEITLKDAINLCTERCKNLSMSDLMRNNRDFNSYIHKKIKEGEN